MASTMEVLSKPLSPTDVGNQLSLPTSCLRLLPPFSGGTNQVSFEAVDASNKVWTFTCSVRRHGHHPKPVLVRSSWLPFVLHNGLLPNDLLTFYYHPDQPIKFRIRFRRLKTIRLLGREITAYAMEE